MSMTSTTETDLVTIGRIITSFGVKGDVRVESLSDVPERFERLPDVRLESPTGERLSTAVTQAKQLANGYYLLRFSAWTSPEEVAPYRGAVIQIPQDADRPMDPNRFYHFELIGSTVSDETGRTLGDVTDILELPQHPVLVVTRDQEEFLIPATRRIVKGIDREARCLTVAALEQWGVPYAV